MGKFEIKSTSSGRSLYVLKAGNGQVILVGKKYSSKDACKNAIESVKVNSQYEGRFKERIANDGRYYFVLKALNGQIIGKSEMYNTKSAMENGIWSVRKNAIDAEIIDNT